MSSSSSVKKPTALWQEIQAPRWETNRTAWLLTCVDLTSLLVGFFVLLFSTQTLKRDQWEAMAGSFQDQFATRPSVISAVPDGVDNAVIRVTGVKSGLGYLDALLHQRMEGDAAWQGLLMENGAKDIAYVLPQGVLNSDDPAAVAAWQRLADVLRGWKNPVGIRVVVGRLNEAGQAAQKAVALGDLLAKSGVNGTFAEVKIEDGTSGKIQLVVRAQ